jgi:hypothetical protein
LQNLRGQRVYGYSHATSSVVQGKIVDIEVDNYDIWINLDRGNETYIGDSGMLIKDFNGQAVAIHLYGNKKFNGIKKIGALNFYRAIQYLETKIQSKLTLWYRNDPNERPKLNI